MSEAAFQRAIRFILPHEEEFARGHWGDERFVIAEHVPGDHGGVTKYGIDQASHPHEDIENLTRDQAIAIYHEEWNAHGLDALPDKLGIACFDVWVNGGYAIMWLQRALNRARPPGTPLIDVDGYLGPQTLSSALLCDQSKVLRTFLAQRDQRFEQLAQKHGQAKFLAGWEQRDRDLAAYLAA